MVWNKQQAEFGLKETELTHIFALKMATIISWAVVSCVVLLSIFSGEITTTRILITLFVALIFGIITFTKTRTACL